MKNHRFRRCFLYVSLKHLLPRFVWILHKRDKVDVVHECEANHCYHQKMSFISKWLYIFALKNRNKRNLPLLLHLISAPFCSVSQSRVPTLMQR